MAIHLSRSIASILVSVAFSQAIANSAAVAQTEIPGSPGRQALQKLIQGFGDHLVTHPRQQGLTEIEQTPVTAPQPVIVPDANVGLRDAQISGGIIDAPVFGVVEVIPGVRANGTWYVHAIPAYTPGGGSVIKCDKNGAFFARLKPGPHFLIPRNPGQPLGESLSSPVNTVNTDTMIKQPVMNVGTIVAFYPAVIAGKISTLSPEELAQCVVYVTNDQHWGALVAAKPAQDGCYLLQGVAPGERQIIVQVPADPKANLPARTLRKKLLVRSNQVYAGIDFEVIEGLNQFVSRQPLVGPEVLTRRVK